MYTMNIYKDKSGQWRWQLKASNGRIIAVGGEAFSSESSARRAAANVMMRIRTGVVKFD